MVRQPKLNYLNNDIELYVFMFTSFAKHKSMFAAYGGCCRSPRNSERILTNLANSLNEHIFIYTAKPRAYSLRGVDRLFFYEMYSNEMYFIDWYALNLSLI